jgi:hypothetical protein
MNLKFSRLGLAANQRVAILAETSRCFIDIATQQIDKSVAVAKGNAVLCCPLLMEEPC